MPNEQNEEARAATLALAHALRTPLTSLALGLGLLDQGALGPLSEAQREVVRALVADAARLSLLVDRELAIEHLGAYAGPVDRVPIELGVLVERAAAPLLPQARERGVAIARALSPGVVVVADPVKLTWVVSSLLGSAIRYSPQGGVVDVRLACSAAGAALHIADQGPGMTPDVRARVFERSGGPSLFLVREIVEAHGGVVDLRSELGQGTTFTITLPAEPGTACTKREAPDEQEG